MIINFRSSSVHYRQFSLYTVLLIFICILDIWDKFSKIFPNIWFGSAFKGATGSNMYVTNIGYHIENHLIWMALQEKENLKFQSIRGFAITGWSRYNIYYTTVNSLLIMGF